MRRKLALSGAIILLALYVVSIILAFIKHPLAESLLLASMFCTMVVPAILYGYSIVLKALKSKDRENKK